MYSAKRAETLNLDVVLKDKMNDETNYVVRVTKKILGDLAK